MIRAMVKIGFSWGCGEIMAVVTLGPWLNYGRGDIRAVVTLGLQ